VLTFSSLLRKKVPDGSEEAEDLDLVIRETKRCAAIIRRLLDFAREKTPEKKFADLNALIEETARIIERPAHLADIQISMDLDPELPRVWVDADLVKQVIMNMLVNAQHAIEEKGAITVRTRRAPGERVEISIIDNGCGITERDLQRIFDPFFTTKGVGKGTGLGLSVSHGIVQAHGGTIEVRSEVGAGTTFTVSLPTTNAPLAAVPAAPPAKPASIRGTVLVVDDEAPVRDTSRRLLTRMGLDVLTACTGEEALAVVADRADIRAVVLDMGMPGMGGAACFRELRKHTSVPVLIATGYAADENMHELFAAGARIIEKPYAATDLRREITLLLEARAEYRRSRGLTDRPRA
jgi:CheY-like chemotaxis protein/anti-sigma regulatory factor (Ser/Thr protein kinase)